VEARAAALTGIPSHPDDGEIGHGRRSHSDAGWYISSVIFHTKYTKRRLNDFNVYAY
jgi:hypothetical protein